MCDKVNNVEDNREVTPNELELEFDRGLLEFDPDFDFDDNEDDDDSNYYYDS